MEPMISGSLYDTCLSCIIVTTSVLKAKEICREGEDGSVWRSMEG